MGRRRRTAACAGKGQSWPMVQHAARHTTHEPV
jgi:hypothetical protein